jgi:hypothetical protein
MLEKDLSAEMRGMSSLLEADMHFTLPLGASAPEFCLPATDGEDAHWMPAAACDLV